MAAVAFTLATLTVGLFDDQLDTPVRSWAGVAWRLANVLSVAQLLTLFVLLPDCGD